MIMYSTATRWPFLPSIVECGPRSCLWVFLFPIAQFISTHCLARSTFVFCSKVIHILYTQQSLPTPREEFNRALRQLPHSFERQQTHRATPCFIQFRDNLFLRLRLCLGPDFVSFTLRPLPLPKHRPARWLEDRGSRLLSSLQNFSLRQLLRIEHPPHILLIHNR